MYIPYDTIINTIETNIKLNDLFNPSNDNDTRIINQIQKIGVVPSPPFPAITISLDTENISYKTIGYTPWASLIILFKIFIGCPADRTPQRLLDDLSLAKIESNWDGERARYYIHQKFMEWLMGDETAEGHSRRCLGCDTLSEVNIGIVKPLNTKFNSTSINNIRVFSSVTQLLIDPIQIL